MGLKSSRGLLNTHHVGQRHSQWTWVQTLSEDKSMKFSEGVRKVYRRKNGAPEILGLAHLPLLGFLHQNKVGNGLRGDAWNFVLYILMALSV